MEDKLARVRWQMGQTLLPDHLFAQEESLLADTVLRFRMSGLPAYGIGRLEWNESLLAEGILSIVALTGVLPSGLLLSVPGNATVKPFNMNITGTNQVAVYLHLMGDHTKVQGSSDTEEEGVPRVTYRLELSSEQSYSNALQTLKLAEFHKTPENAWLVLEDYIPPLLQMGTSPFATGMVDSVAQLLEIFEFKLVHEITASYLSGESLFAAKQCLKGVYTIKRFMVNLKSQIHYHPYYFYEALQLFYVDVCIYQNFTPDNVETPYLHDELGPCLKKVLQPLLGQMQLIKSAAPYFPFKKQEGLFAVAKLPKEVYAAQEVYFLLQKPHVSTPVSLEGIKLASLNRISLVHQLSLQGIPLTKMGRLPFQHSFGAEVEFFLMSPGEEWDYALRDGSLAFYDRPMFDKMNAYLYWRQG